MARPRTTVSPARLVKCQPSKPTVADIKRMFNTLPKDELLRRINGLDDLALQANALKIARAAYIT